jgi:hypothetical protein
MAEEVENQEATDAAAAAVAAATAAATPEDEALALEEEKKRKEKNSKLKDLIRKEIQEMYDGMELMNRPYPHDEQVNENNTTRIEDKIKSGEIKPEEVKAAAEKAIKGDTTDLALLMSFGQKP